MALKTRRRLRLGDRDDGSGAACCDCGGDAVRTLVVAVQTVGEALRRSRRSLMNDVERTAAVEWDSLGGMAAIAR